MAGTILRCALRGSTGIALIALCAATAARAEVSISNQPTSDMSCTGGVCTATAPKAVLNAGDLANMLGSGDVTVETGAAAKDIEVKQALSWTSTNRLTLDAQQSVTIDKPVTVAGTGSLTITTNDGGKKGEFVIAPKASVQFWDLTSSLVIDGNSYTLVGDIKTLASDIAASPSGFYALAKPYDASVDGTYSSAPIATKFFGGFNGLGNAISNVSVQFIANQTFDDSALFGEIGSTGGIRNLGVMNAILMGSGNGAVEGLGLLASDNFGLVDKCWATGTISSPGGDGAFPGGLIGGNYGTITRSYSNTSIALFGGAGIHAGGLVGYNQGTINESYAAGSATITMSYDANTGALAGYNRGTVSNTFSRAAVHDRRWNLNASYFGGLIGNNDTGGKVISSFSAGKISMGHSGQDDSVFGGLVGFDGSDAGSFSHTYWDLDKGVSDPSQGAGNVKNDPGVTGLTSAQLQSELPQGFDPKIWGQNSKINSGFPYLLGIPTK